MWINKPFFKYATGIILALIIIFLFGKIDYFLLPFQQFIGTLFFPVLIAGFLYYILRPVVHVLSKKLPKSLSILIVFAVFFGLLAFAIYTFGPLLTSQVQNIVKQFPDKFSQLSSEYMKDFNLNQFITSDEDIKQKVMGYATSVSKYLAGNVFNIITTIASIATILVVVPFILFYFLKDDHKLRPFMLKWLPSEHEAEGNRILVDVDKALSNYIVGQFIIACVDGVLMYIGFLIIGLDSALVLAIFATCLTVVPFLGPFLGILPALFVAFQTSPVMALKVLIVLIVVQQIEGNLISPNVMGKRLDVHPLTILLLLLVAGSLYGLIGILIAIPAYSVIKTIVKNFILFYRLRNRKKREERVL
ncbi:AI-2E family transporter [Metabacillus sp. GX 13764]|uniref:AI-2E family transporter n=1 Tax=Metabacillus kandeliae TaxID=2900151 RepID=UPI001E4C082E|nr:AI-2E family transporter [Metabacillus kandeliae]MCD7034437.1 AI-2E family transporter [Metabacillus kandeliae]